MDFLELTRERYSVRKFSNKKVEEDKLNLILEAGRLAPTAVNYQPQRILVIENEESLTKLKECTPYHFNAPLALLVCYDSTVSWKRHFDKKDMGDVDAAIVTTQMMLEVSNLGLGTTWVGHFSPELIKEKFELPNYFIPVAILPIGYPSEDAIPSKQHNTRYDTNQTVFYNSFESIK